MLSRRQVEKYADWLALLLLLLFFGRLLQTAAANAITFDEILHLFQGVLYWQHEQLYSVVRNPPLINAVIGLPVSLVSHPDLPPDLARWALQDWLQPSKLFMWEVNTNGLQLAWLGRLAIILLSTMLGALVYRWGKMWGHSPLAGLAALLFYSFDPNILAHSHLATTDIGTAFFFFLAAYLVWCYWQSTGRFSLSPFLSAGVAIGCALAAKFSGLILVQALLIMTVYRLISLPQERRQWRRVTAETIGWLAIAALVFLSIYRFELGTLRLDFALQQEHQLSGHSAFLLGQISNEGWWFYFPVVLAVKTALPALALVLLSLLLLVLRRQASWRYLWTLLIAAGIVGAGLTSRVNIGYRYLLPALPLLYLVAGQLVAPAYITSRLLRWGIAGAILWMIVESLWIHPHYLSYFNQLAGGPDHGWRVVVDSNIDWGQDIQALSQYMAEKGIETINASWLGTAPLEAYGINGRTIAGWPQAKEEPLYDWFYPKRPAPGVYALSVTQLQGVYLEDRQRFQWFRQREPDDKVGYSLFVYDVAAEGEPVGLALSGIGIGAISLPDYQQAFAGNNVTPRWYDARTSFLWPGGGEREVWAAVGEGHLSVQPVLQAMYPADGPTLLGMSDEGFRYRLYQLRQSPITAVLAQATQAGSAHTAFRWTPEPGPGSTDWENDWMPLGEPALFGGALELLGYQMIEPVAQPGQALELLTFWRIHDQPQVELSTFLHLLDAEGNLVAQHDGLDVHTTGLQAGDELAQLHTILLPPTLSGRYGLQIGLYEHHSLNRLPVITMGKSVDRLLLQRFTVE